MYLLQGNRNVLIRNPSHYLQDSSVFQGLKIIQDVAWNPGSGRMHSNFSSFCEDLFFFPLKRSERKRKSSRVICNPTGGPEHFIHGKPSTGTKCTAALCQLWASYIACRVSIDTKLNFPLPWRFFGLMNITDKVLANTQWLEFCHFQWENIHKKCFFSNQTTPLLWVSFSLPTADPTQHGVKKGYEDNELDKMHPSKWCSSHCLNFPGCGTVKKELGNCPFWWEEMAREKTCFSRSEDSQLGLLSTWEFFIPTFLFLFFKLANKNTIIANSY